MNENNKVFVRKLPEYGCKEIKVISPFDEI